MIIELEGVGGVLVGVMGNLVLEKGICFYKEG